MAIDRIDANPPLFGGGSTGNVSVNATTPWTILDGGTEASTRVGARHSLFTMGGDAVGDIYARSSATALGRVAAGVSGYVLTSNGPGTLPTWQASAGGPGGGGGAAVGPTPPASPTPGDLWWDSVGGQLYVWYDDGTTAQWVAASAGGPGGGADTVANVVANMTTPTALTIAALNVVTGDGAVALPTAPAAPTSGHCYVRNNGSNPIEVEPPSGVRINDLAVGARLTIDIRTMALFKSASVTQWYSM